MLRFMCDLHYGKLNPDHPAKKTDADTRIQFQAVEVLLNACLSNNFIACIEAVQPKSADYAALKYWMYTAKGVQTGDCYETPEAMENRLRLT